MTGFAKTEKKYPAAPEGLWQAVCVDQVDKGMLPGFEGKLTPKIDLFFALECKRDDGEPFIVMRRFTNSAHEKGHLRPFLESFRGKKFTPEELATWDFEKLIGKNCQLQITHRIRADGEVFANITSVVPIRKEMIKLPIPEGYVRHKDRATVTNRVDESDVPF